MRKVILTLAIALHCLVMQAQEKLSLQQAIETGLKNNFGILIAKNNAEISSNNLSVGNAGMLPAVDVLVNQNNSITDTKQKLSTGVESDRNNATGNTFSASAQLSWTIFDGFKMFATYKKLKELNALGELAAKQQMEAAVQDIITTYFNVVKQQALLEVADDSRNVSEIKLNLAKTKYTIGTTSKTENLQAQVDKNADDALYKKQVLAIDLAKINLNRLLARDVNTDFNISDSITNITTPVYTDLVAQLKSKNLSLLSAQHYINVSGYMIKEWQGQRFPVIGVIGNYTYSKSNSQTGVLLENRSKGFNYGFTLSYNIFNGFNTHRNISNARLDLENAKLNYNLAQSSVEGELLAAFKTFESNYDILKMQRDNGALASENVSIALERFRVGTTNELLLKEAQRSNVEAQTNLVTALYDTKLAETALQKLTGDLLK